MVPRRTVRSLSSHINTTLLHSRHAFVKHVSSTQQVSQKRLVNNEWQVSAVLKIRNSSVCDMLCRTSRRDHLKESYTTPVKSAVSCCGSVFPI